MMISVVIPVYNVEKYIKACLTSVLAQKYRSFELIVVDDGSPDGSMQIAENVLSEASDIPYRIIHTENRGVSGARNTGLRAARGEYIVMVDADDVLADDFLSDYARMIRDEGASDIYSSSFTVVTANGATPSTQREEGADPVRFAPEEAQRVFFNRSVKFLLPTLLFRKDFLTENALLFDEAVRYSEDVQFIWRCLAYNRKPVIHTSRSNYQYILHPGSTMTASGIPKMLTCIGGLERLYADVENRMCPEIRDRFLPRMYFSLLHSAAKMTAFGDFKRLHQEANCRPFVQREAKCGSLKTKAVSRLLLLCPRTGYLLMRRF